MTIFFANLLKIISLNMPVIIVNVCTVAFPAFLLPTKLLEKA